MKKSLLLFALGCFALTLWAGNGSSQKSPIEFDWENGNIQEATTQPTWFRVGLDELYTEANPSLALYIINETDSTIHVSADATLLNQTENRQYDIEAYQNKIWSVPVGMLVRMKAKECYLTLTTNGKIRISANVQDVRDIDNACINAQNLAWGTPTDMNAGSKWYMISLRDAKSAANSGKKAQLTLKNMTSSPATVKFLDSPDCPSTGTTEHSFELAGNATETVTVPRMALDMLDQTETYLQLTTSAKIQFTIAMVEAATPTQTVTSPNDINLNQEFDIVNGQWYRIKLADIHVRKYMPELKVTNTTGSPVTFNEDIMYATSGEVFTREDITIAANSSNIVTMQPNIIETLVDAGYTYMYIRANNATTLKGFIRMRHIHEGEDCATPRDLKSGVAEHLDAATPVWYALPLEDLQSTTPYNDLKLTVNSLENTTLTLQVTTACPAYDTQDYTYSISDGVEFTKTFPSSFFRMLLTDSIFVSMESAKALNFTVTVVPAPAPSDAGVCASAVDFDWTYGHQLTAGANQWYNIDLSPLHLNGATAELLPVLSIKNRGSVSATVQMKMSRDCPLKSEPVVREVSIPAGETYESTISMDMITDINPSLTKLWAYISSSQDIDWRIRFVRENEGSSCAVPYLFNWVSGNDINNATAWYMLDLTEAKASDKDIILSIDNLDAAASLTLGLAPTCPCDAPQEQSTSFKAHQHRESRVVHSSFAAMPDTVWVRASTVGRFHVEAKLVDPEPFTPITIVNPTPINWGETIAQSAGDSVWYYILPDTLNKVSDLTARLKIVNGSAYNIVYTHQTYAKEITSQLAEMHMTVGANSTAYRVFERSMANLMAAKDTVYVCLVADGAFTFTVELADPNTGNNCEHAILITPGQHIEVPAGADLWYRVDIAGIADTLSYRMGLTLQNFDNTAGKVTVSLHTSCDSAAFQSSAYNLGANAQVYKEFDSDFIKGLNMDMLYAHVTAEALDSIITTLVPEIMLEDTIFICDSAIACVPNTDYVQHAGDTVWYSVDIRNIRENTRGDATLVVTNNGVGVNHLVGELSWVCPVVKQMTYKSYDVSSIYERVVERSAINSYKQDIAYLRIVGDKDFTFRVNAQLAKGDRCTNPILFDWNNGNVHPADSVFWYRVEMDSTRFEDRTNPDSIVYMDMRLLVENLADDSTSAGADIFFDCDDPSLGSFNYTFAPGGSKYKDIDRDLIAKLGWPDMYLSYSSGNSTRITASFIKEAEKVYFYDTIQATVCDSSEFQYRINEDKLIVHEIYSGNLASQQWTDTVSFMDGTALSDSVYFFHVKPIVMLPILNTAEALDTIAHALPILKQGMVPFFDLSLVALRNYYKSIMTDTLSAIVDEDDIYWYNEYYTPLSKTMTTFNAYYAFQDSCSNWYNFNLSHDYEPTAEKITFMVEPWRYDTILVSTDTICPGDSVTIGAKKFAVHGEVYLRDTIQNITVPDTLGLPRKIDSVYVYHYYTWNYPEDLEKALPQMPVVACGKSVDCTKPTQYLKSIYMPDEKFDSLDVTITELIWQRLNLTTTEFEDLPAPATENRLDSAVHQVVLRYGLVTECSDTVFSDTIQITAEPYVRVYEAIADTVCAGTNYIGVKTNHTIEVPSTAWNDTVIVVTDSLTFDSVYSYTIYTYVAPVLEGTLPSQPLVACGKVIDCSAATAALRQTYMPEVKTNPLDVTVTDVIWQRKDVGAGTYAALDSTRVDRAVTSVVLRYGLVTECDTVYSVDFEFTPTAYVVVEETVLDTVCSGTDYQGAKTNHTISAYTTWNDIILVETDSLTFDSVYIYQISVYEALVLPVYTTPLAAHAGMPVDVTAQTSELEADFAQKNKQSLDDITWEILLPSASWTALTTDPLAAALAGQTVQLRYTVKALCETKTSDAIDVDVHGYYRVDTTIIDMVCLGTAYEGRLTTHTITALTEWTDSVRTEDLIASDSVFHYSVVPYLFALPEDLDLAGIIAICDTAVSVEAPQAQIDELMADPLFAPNTVVTWQMFRGSQWDTLTADPIYDDEVRIRVNITSDCGTLTSDEITLTVVKPTADNQTRYNSLPVEAMFGNRIIMINYRATREVLGLDSISPDSVRWYRVVGELDNLDLPAGTGDDEFLGTGYYYTTGEPLTGSFYARLMYHESVSLPCGVVARTKVVDCVLNSSAPKLSPTVVRPRQVMSLSGIVPDAAVTVSVFSQLGELVGRYSGTGATLTEIEAASSEGCYLVHIAYDDESTTFKYIVK